MSSPETWVDEYGDILFRYALGRVRNEETAQELVQETLLAALRAQKNFQGKSSLKTWLISILKHKILDHFRKNVRELQLNVNADDDPFEALFDEKGMWKEPIASWELDPERAFEQKEFVKTLYDCIGKLRKNMAAVFVLREMENMKTGEICKELGITSSNLWVLLYRARMQLRKCLEVNWFQIEKEGG